MEKYLPMVSIIMATYNRAHTIERAVKSVLNQTYKNFELIIIDDGSVDDTLNILKKYEDPRIRIYRHDVNKGVTAAKNSGLKQIRGEWFTTFDSDDEMMPHAIETMMDIPLKFDNTITSVTCNCVEAGSGNFTGIGLTKDGYIDANKNISFCEGDYWGLTKTELLHGELFNENLIGYESTLWYKINARSKSYYIHKALNTIYVEGTDRVTVKKFNLDKKVRHYESLVGEDFFLSVTGKYNPKAFNRICRNGILLMNVAKNHDAAKKYYQTCNKIAGRNLMIELVYRFRFLSAVYRKYVNLRNA